MSEVRQQEYLVWLEEQTSFHISSDCLDAAMKSKLIMMSAKYCKQYLSDIIVDINVLEKRMRMHQHDIYATVGFRDSGTDHAEYVLARYEDRGAYNNEPWKSYNAAVTIECHIEGTGGFYDISFNVVEPKQMMDFVRKHQKEIRHPYLPPQLSLWR